MKKIISALLIITMLVSMVCVSTSAAGIRINMNFESMEVFTSQFVAGAFYVDDAGVLYGYAEAKALQTQYQEDDNGFFTDAGLSWLTFDTTITLKVQDDDLSEAQRWINLVYCNDNLAYEGAAEGRVMMAFSYDIEGRCFRLTQGWNNTNEEEQYLPPVAKEIDTDGNSEITLGMSVSKDRIRCFYNNELIFDLQDTNYYIAQTITAPFLFWQDGNYVQITNITVADEGYLFPMNVPGPEPTETTPGNDVTTTTTRVTTTSEVVVNITDAIGNTVTDSEGNAVTSISIVTEAPAPADTNTNRPAGGNASSTGDATFVVVAAMVATLGCALIVKKVSAK